MRMSFRTPLLEKVPMLILLGILAGAMSGLVIGVIQSRPASFSSRGR
jgi:ABC-type uncharacterized transport system permease subunit